MSFESGSVTMRPFISQQELEEDSSILFLAHALPFTENVQEAVGWTGTKHLLERDIADYSIKKAGHLHINLVKAERKIPPSLLKTECKIEEIAEMSATGNQFLKRQARAEIKKAVTDRLLPQMPLTLSAVETAGCSDGHTYLSTATSDSNVDSLCSLWKETLQSDIIPLTPEVSALHHHQVQLNDFRSASFSPTGELSPDSRVGDDFLTWLWYHAETQGGMIGKDSEFAVLFEGPLTFVHEGMGAHETILRKGMPTASLEAKQALTAGKKLRKAKLTVARGEDVFSFNLDSLEWVFSGMKIPTDKTLDPISRFQARVLAIEQLLQVLVGVYGEFLSLLEDGTLKESVVADMREWISDRVGKA